MSSRASRAAAMRSPEAEAAFAPDLPFALVSGGEGVMGRGCRSRLPEGDPASLAERVAAFFAGDAGGPRRLVGALPFDRTRPAHLYQPEELGPPDPVLARPAGPQVRRWSVRLEPGVEAYRAAVRRALALMAGPAASPATLRKVVLSRTLRIDSDRAIDARALLAALAEDEAVTSFCVPLPSRQDAPHRALIGATPELLLDKAGRRVVSHPLAGSARRRPDPAADRDAAEALLRSDKDRREHGEVVEAVLDTLAPYCSRLAAPDGIGLVSTRSMWHLGTRIEGELKDPAISSIEIVARLHPTPAVCGTPREAAYRAISRLEPLDRDFYGGAVGWCDAGGDGRWHVAIRCAEVAGTAARLYAGAGIVPGSDPAAEADETGAKFGALLAALGIDERAVEAAS